jgi:hypothetical protein
VKVDLPSRRLQVRRNRQREPVFDEADELDTTVRSRSCSPGEYVGFENLLRCLLRKKRGVGEIPIFEEQLRRSQIVSGGIEPPFRLRSHEKMIASFPAKIKESGF